MWNPDRTYNDREVIGQNLNRLNLQTHYVPPGGGHEGCIDVHGEDPSPNKDYLRQLASKSHAASHARGGDLRHPESGSVRLAPAEVGYLWGIRTESSVGSGVSAGHSLVA